MTNSSKEFSDAVKYWFPLTLDELHESFKHNQKGYKSFPEFVIGTAAESEYCHNHDC